MVKFGNMRWGRFAFTAFGSFCLKKLSGSPEPPKQKNFHKGGAGAGGHFVTQIYIANFLYIEATFYHEKRQKTNANANVPRNPLYLFLEKRVPWRGSKAV